MKKHVVALKNKSKGLEDGLNHAEKELSKLSAPTEKLRADLEQKRKESMAQLKQLSIERTQIEREIYTTGSKLRTAMEENHHFTESNDNMTTWIASLEQEITDTDKLMKELEIQLQTLKESLSTEWNKDNDIQKVFAKRDEALVEELGKLLSTTERREKTISSITERLNQELTVLGEFLDNVAKRRPKESSKGRRPLKSAKSQTSPRSNMHSSRTSASAKSVRKSAGERSLANVKSGPSDEGKPVNVVKPSTNGYPVLSPIPPSARNVEVQ